jgi:tetratricopeptide (TPR) repeat protein
VRAEFRAQHTPSQLKHGIDEALKLNKEILQRVRLLYQDDHGRELLTIVPSYVDTTNEHNARVMASLSPRDRKAFSLAHSLMTEALTHFYEVQANATATDRDSRLLEHQLRLSLQAFPLPEVHVCLAGIYITEGEWERAEVECQRAIKLDPEFGEAFGVLAHMRFHQGDDDAAVELFEKAKRAPRNTLRPVMSLRLAVLHLDKARLKPALHECIQALHWMDAGDDRAVDIRETVASLATSMLTVNDSAV